VDDCLFGSEKDSRNGFPIHFLGTSLGRISVFYLKTGRGKSERLLFIAVV
jgi:hypothetical protein